MMTTIDLKTNPVTTESLDYTTSFRIDYVRNLRKEFNIRANYRFNSKKFELDVKKAVNLSVSLNKLLYMYDNLCRKYVIVILSIKIGYLISWTHILLASLPPEAIISIIDITDEMGLFSGLFL